MIKVEVKNLDRVKKSIEKYAKSIDGKRREVLEKTHARGVTIGHGYWSGIEYDGDHTVDIPQQPEWIEDKAVALSFKSEEVTFIEFGTGTQTYPDDHPKRGDPPFDSFVRGEYGGKQGRNLTWKFGADGRPITISTDTGKSLGGDRYLTYGNPANRVVYNTGKDLKEELPKIAKEVFKK